jgi:hypothetical protein
MLFLDLGLLPFSKVYFFTICEFVGDRYGMTLEDLPSATNARTLRHSGSFIVKYGTMNCIEMHYSSVCRCTIDVTLACVGMKGI